MPGIDAPAAPPAETLSPGSGGGTPLPKIAGPPTVSTGKSTSPSMTKARAGLQKLAGVSEATPPTETPPVPAKPEPKPKVEPKPTDKPAGGPEDLPTKELKTTPETPPKVEDKGKAPGEAIEDGAKEGSPWRLVKTLQAQNSQLVREMTQLKSGDKGTVAQLETLTKRADAAEKRAAELEAEIRFVDYSKSSEFGDKYKKPYDDAWKRAISDLDELTITDETGVTRKATVHDMVALAELPLSEASKQAKLWFGDAATDMMAHRRQLRDLNEAQQKALEDARKQGDERNQQTTAERTRIQQEVRTQWNQAIIEEQSKRNFLQEVEGDEAWNKKLAEAVAFVDGAAGRNPNDPKLTPEQRSEVIRQHAAIRNRAVGFAMRGVMIDRLNAQLKEAKAEIASYKQSEPPTTSTTTSKETGVSGATAMEQSRAKLRALGKAS